MPDKKYKILSHTADLRLEVFGKTLEELFENAAEAIADILATSDKREVKSEKRKVKSDKRQVRSELGGEIKVESANLNALLVDFLNEILARSQINKAVYRVSGIWCRVSGVSASVEAELVGQKVDKFDEDIKAVTYHETDVKQEPGTRNQEPGAWSTKLVIDI